MPLWVTDWVFYMTVSSSLLHLAFWDWKIGMAIAAGEAAQLFKGMFGGLLNVPCIGTLPCNMMR